MLIGNYGVFSPMRFIGFNATNQTQVPLTISEAIASRRNFWAGYATVISGVSIANKSAIPDGYYPPHTIVISPKGGAMRSTDRIEGEGDVSGANLAGGLAAVAALTGSGAISNADNKWVAVLVAALSGSGALAAAATGAAFAVAGVSGAGDATAVLTGLGFQTTTLTGTGTISSAVALAQGFMSANLDAFGTALSTGNVGAAVWSEVLEAIAGGTEYNAQQIMQTLFAVLAGKVTGGPGSPVFKSPSDGSTARVASTADSDGNRSAVTITTS